MADPPKNPKIYHITHVDNLSRVIRAGALFSDSERLAQGLDCTLVGMSEIKRRLEELRVTCFPGTMVGEYVPFHFCPRSIMLYILHMANHPDISYQKGQRPIVHLVADMHTVVQWARANDVAWAFTSGNAGARYASFFSELGSLERVNWDAVGAKDFRPPPVKEGKQAEFLIHKALPWKLVEGIGVSDADIQARVTEALRNASHQPTVCIERTRYY